MNLVFYKRLFFISFGKFVCSVKNDSFFQVCSNDFKSFVFLLFSFVFKKKQFFISLIDPFFCPSFVLFWIKYPFPRKRTCQIFPWDFRKMNIIEGLHSMVLVNYIYVLSLGVPEILFCIIPHSSPKYPAVPRLSYRYGEFK